MVFCGKCKCTNSHWCVDVFFDIISISFLALLVFGGKCMRQNSQGCVDVFFRVIFGVSGLRWEMNVWKLAVVCWRKIDHFAKSLKVGTFKLFASFVSGLRWEMNVSILAVVCSRLFWRHFLRYWSSVGNARAKPIEGVLTSFFYYKYYPTEGCCEFCRFLLFFLSLLVACLLLVAKRGPKDSVVAGVNFPVQQSSGWGPVFYVKITHFPPGTAVS